MARTRAMIEAEVAPMKMEGNVVGEGWLKATQILMRVAARKLAAADTIPAVVSGEATLQPMSARA